jgi:hypothetical protein
VHRDLARGDQRGAGGPGIVNVLLARAAETPRTHLHDAVDPGHFAGAPHRRRKPEANAMHLVAPVA